MRAFVGGCRCADACNRIAIPPEGMLNMFDSIKQLAKQAGARFLWYGWSAARTQPVPTSHWARNAGLA